MSETQKFVLSQSIWIVIQLAVISFCIFFLLRSAIPGDALQTRFGKSSERTLDQVRHELGWDRNIVIQYGDYMRDFLRGDFGYSFQHDQKTVWELLKPRLWKTVQLAFAAFIMGFPLGIGMGLLAARWSGTWKDPALIGMLMVFSSIHTIIFVQFLILIFAVKLGVLPIGGWGGLFSLNSVIPLTVLVLPGLASGVRFTRANALHVINEGYIRTAYAKGLSEKRVLLRHVLPNAAHPIFYPLVADFPIMMITGFLFVEMEYGIQGTGSFMVESLRMLDYNVIMATSIIIAGIALAMRRVADVAIGIMDPRVRIGKSKIF
jgi:ABC-type dipeptide/oligopeptide/nickel transport system permease component